MADAQAISGFFPATVREAYANQVDYCRANDAPVTARIVEAIGGLLDAADPGAFIAAHPRLAGRAAGRCGAAAARRAGCMRCICPEPTPELAAIYAD